MTAFDLVSPHQPAGDQPEAIRELTEGLQRGDAHQVLLGATGTGKTCSIAHVIANYGRPTLVMSHNKTLAAQLYGELKANLSDLSPAPATRVSNQGTEVRCPHKSESR